MRSNPGLLRALSAVVLSGGALLPGCASEADAPADGTGAGGMGFGATGGVAPGGAGGVAPGGAGGVAPGGAGGVAPGGAGGVAPGGAGGVAPGGAGGGGGTGGAGGGGTGGAGGGAGGSGGGSFVNLAPPMGAPLDRNGATALNPAAPSGWNWYPIDGAICRDGSPTGFYVHWGTADKLLMYLEGGGACTNTGFCDYNPKNVNTALSGTGETVAGSALGAAAGVRQQPGVYTGGVPQGIFDFANAANPFKDWSEIYIPYCTGDVHFGTRADATVPGTTEKQQFVGYLNMEKFVARIVPTFKDTVSRVIITGSSAGGFGAALNFSMVQDSFGSIPVDAIDDAGPPFFDEQMPVCMQKRWRETWGFENSFPPDCTECNQADGGGMIHLSDFLLRKHPNAKIALVSAMQDEVIRLFYSMGLKDCSTIDTTSPVAITLGQVDPTVYMPGATYEAGLNQLRSNYLSTNRFATYYMAGLNVTLHQHLFRQRFYESAAGGKTIAQFVQGFLDGTVEQVGP